MRRGEEEVGVITGVLFRGLEWTSASWQKRQHRKEGLSGEGLPSPPVCRERAT